MNTSVIRHCAAERRPSFAASCAATSLRRAAALVIALAALTAAPAFARFGFDAADPVCTTTVGGEYRYLSRLRGADGTEVKARRQGSTFVRGFDFPMDVWTLRPGTNDAVTVYMYGYGDTNSLAAPEGFVLLPADAPGLVEPERSTSVAINADGSGAVAIYEDEAPKTNAVPSVPADPSVKAVLDEMLRIVKAAQEKMEKDGAIAPAATEALAALRAVDASAAPEDFRKAFGETLDAVARMTDITVRLGETAFMNPPAKDMAEIEAATDAAEEAGAKLKKAAASHGVPWHDIFDEL